ncbi:hypothetical protein [Aliamphritea ceti]|uniref:hypothetical protein n=1 Tax=Aliamphritea ceti TaxID=1524258 RepID=UPI0021C467EC|nr:hypothetical protein [Aliamphritea ceti]
MKIYKNDSDDLGFAYTCLFSQAVNLSEFKKWAEKIVLEVDDCPDYIFELIDFEGEIYKMNEAIGFSPSWDHDINDEYALIGLAYKRGVEVYDSPISKKNALEVLHKNIGIEDRFKSSFPFIAFG